MAFKFPDKDPDEKLDYTVDWSRYLDPEGLTISSATWKIEKLDGTAITFAAGKVFQNDVLVPNDSATAGIASAVSSSTTVELSGVSGIPQVGHLVTGTGITEDVYVTSKVNWPEITLSAPITVASDVTLTFSSVGLRNATTPVIGSDNKTTTIVLEKGQANKTYTLVCEITTTESAKTTDPIVTNRRIKLKVRERM
jgi:hypothetical protein